MVAIAVLSVATSAVYFSNSEALASQRALEHATIAQWLLSNEVSKAKLAAKVQGQPDGVRAPPDSTSARLEYAGLEWDLEARTVSQSEGHAVLRRWELYLIVDGEAVGPIRNVHAVIWEGP